MNVVRAAGTIVFGLLPLLVGCVQQTVDANDEEVGVVHQATGDDKFPHSNGLGPEQWSQCKSELVVSMGYRIYTDGNESVLNPALPASVRPPTGNPATGGECLQAFTYAEFCARNVTAAANWLHTGGISYVARERVLACVAAFVNQIHDVSICGYGQGVVSPLGGACLQHYVDEGLFTCSIQRATNGVTCRVWVLHGEVNCPATTPLDEILKQRFCTDPDTQTLSDCGIERRNSVADDCTGQAPQYTCLGAPAFATYLDASGWFAAWQSQGCYPPPQ